MGKQVRPSIIALLASVPLVLLAAVGIVAALPDGPTVSDEATLFAPRPIWEHAGPNYGYDPSGPASYNAFSVLVPTHAPPGNCASVIGCIVPNPTYYDAEPEAAALDEYQILLASLSPGVRASYDGAVLAQQEDAKKREHERDEAAYAVFIEEHLRRLNEERRSRK